MTEENLANSITVDEVYRRAARKSIIFFIAGDEESEQNLAMELGHVREEPELYYGPILAVLKELFPDEKYPPHLQTLHDEMRQKEAERESVMTEDMFVLGMNLVEALSNLGTNDKKDEA